MRGRKPRPTVLKVLEGCREDRINRSEPRYAPPGAPTPPAWLGGFGAERWAELYPLLSASGMLTAADLPAFEQLCDEYDGIRRDPLDGAARDRYRKLLVEFGLTPSSRSRVKTDAAPRDALADFLARRKG